MSLERFPSFSKSRTYNNNNIKEFKYGVNKEELFSPKGVCNQIKNNGPSIIFISDDKPEVDCLKKIRIIISIKKLNLNQKMIRCQFI